ncbi:hypothetical protein BVX98_05985, partial [bacterium F11]
RPFTIDYSSPTSSVDSLSTTATSYINVSLTVVSGTADEEAGGSGISSVNIRVRRSDGDYLNAAEIAYNDSSDNFPLPTTNGTSWEKTFINPLTSFQDGYRYEIESRAIDNSSPANTQEIFTTAVFVVDKSTPTSYLASSLTDGYFNDSLTVISGTMDEPIVGGGIFSGVDEVNIKIYDGAGGANPWWDGSTWVNPSISSTPATVHPSSWSVSSIPSDWVDEQWYQFYIQAVDRATNTETYHVYTATYDVKPGTAAIIDPDASIVSSLPTISGTATDSTFGTQTIADIQIGIQRDDTLWYRFSDEKWIGSPVWNSVEYYNPGSGDWYQTSDQSNLWENLKDYSIYVKALDKAGNLQSTQVVPSTTTFLFEPPPAAVGLTKPKNNRFYVENLISIGGTANTDAVRVEIQIERYSDPVNNYWSSVSETWVNFSTWTDANDFGIPNWTWTSSIPASGDWFTHGASFTVRARGYNSAQLIGPVNNAVFAFDTQEPNSVLTKPLISFTSSFAQVSGTANDQLDLAGVNNIELDIQRITKPNKTAADDFYWNGSTWVAGRPGLSATVNYDSPNLWNWFYDVVYSTMPEEGYEYRIFYTAEDEAYTEANTLDGNDEVENSFNVVYDVIMPTASINSVQDGSFRSTVYLASGSLTDTLGAGQDAAAPGYGQIEKVEMSLERLDNNSFWDGSAFQPGPDPIYSTVTLHISSWSYTSLPDFGQSVLNKKSFRMRMKALDKAGNENALFIDGVSQVTFTIDNKKPITTITIPTSNAKRSILSSIDGTVDDNTADYPDVAGISRRENIEVLVFYLLHPDTYYWNGIAFSSSITEGQAWQTVDSYNALGPSSGTWTYNALDSLKMDPPDEFGWISDISYEIRSRATDDAFPSGNVASPAVSLNVIIDTTTPTSGVTLPNATPISSLETISGTGIADLAGMADMKFSIQDHTNNFFDNSSFGSASEIFLDTQTYAGAVGTQVYSSTYVETTDLTPGSTYTIRIYATDDAAPTPNTQVGGSPATFQFLFDNVAPQTLTVSAPVVLGSYGPNNPLNNITGQAQDNQSTLSSVELEILNATDGFYWGGSAFDQASSSWVVVSPLQVDWSYSAPAWLLNKTYQLRARASDIAGNVSTTSVVTFKYDSTAPVVSVVLNPYQLYQTTGTLDVLSGTAHDGLVSPRSGLQKIEIALFDADDADADKWWDGTAFDETNRFWRVTSSTISGATSSAPWSYPFGSDQIPAWQEGHQYELHVQAMDESQNMSSVVVSTFVFDMEIPTGTITAPFDGPDVDYERYLPTISGISSDSTNGPRPGSINMVQIRVWHVGGTVWWDLTEGGGPDWDSDSSLTPATAWFNTTSTNSWTNWFYDTAVPNWVSGIAYAVSMRVIDDAGNQSGVSYSTFTFDTNLPESVVTSPTDDDVINSLGALGIEGTADDSGSPVTKVRIAVRKLDDGLWWNSVNDDFTDSSATPIFRSGVTLTPSGPDWDWNYPITSLGNEDLTSGVSYYITTEASDAAGNVENDFQSGSSTFTVDNSNPLSKLTRPIEDAVFYGGEPYYSSLPIISGTADDFTFLPANANLNAGIAPTGVKVSIYSHQLDLYWKETPPGFTEADEGNSYFTVTFVGSSSGTWTYGPAGFNAALTDGTTYVIKSSATDLVTNTQVVLSTQIFVFDSSGPVTLMQTPLDGVDLKVLTIISGTAQDYPLSPLQRVGMDRVELQIIDLGEDHAFGGSGADEDRYWVHGGSSFTTNSTTHPIYISGQGNLDWSYDNPDGMWEDGHTYHIRATAIDALNNPTGVQETAEFVFDSSAPVSVVTRPIEGVGYNASSNKLDTISADVADMPVLPLKNVGLDTAQVMISIMQDFNNNNVEDDTNNYWTGTYNPGAFNSNTRNWVAMGWDTGVKFSTGTPDWQSGYRYFLRIKSQDTLVNLEAEQTVRFTVDILEPNSLVTLPGDDTSHQDLDEISGTATDATSSITEVKVKIIDLGADFAYGGSDENQDKYRSPNGTWISASTKVTAGFVDVFTTSATWNLTTVGAVLPNTWLSGRVYWVIPEARDSADNIETVFSTMTFKIDNVPPVAGIITPPNNSGYNSLTTLNGTAEGTELLPGSNLDFSLISSVKIQIIDLDSDPISYWDGAIFNSNVSTITTTFVGLSSGTWSYNEVNLNNNYISGHRYLVKSWATDSAGNVQGTFAAGVSSNTFSFDNVAASATISLPVDGAAYRTFTQFDGTGGDDFSGVKDVDLTVSYLDSGDTYYFDGVNFSSETFSTVASSVVVQFASAVSWSFDTTDLLPKLVTDREYRVFARGGDKADNFETIGTTVTFLFDLNHGTATFTDPTGAGVYLSPANPLSEILGSAVDAPTHPFAGVSYNELRILRNPPGNEYWNGSTWVGVSTRVVTTGTDGWSYAEPSANWQDNTQYLLYVRTIDLAGNISPESPEQVFVWDASTPTVVLQDPDVTIESSLTQISGTAGDGANVFRSKLYSVEVAIRRDPTNPGENYWDGDVGDFTITEIAYNAAGGDLGTMGWHMTSTTTDGGHWELPVSSMPTWVDGTEYLVKVRAKDVALNFSNPITSFTFVYDSVKPISRVTFPDGTEVRSTISQITGTADDTDSAVSQVFVSVGQLVGLTTSYFDGAGFNAATEYFNLTNWSGSDPWTYNTAIPYASGLKYMLRSYAVDEAGNVETALPAQIEVYYDVTKPTTTIYEPGQASFISAMSQVKGTAYDKTAEVESLLA